MVAKHTQITNNQPGILDRIFTSIEAKFFNIPTNLLESVTKQTNVINNKASETQFNITNATTQQPSQVIIRTPVVHINE